MNSQSMGQAGESPARPLRRRGYWRRGVLWTEDCQDPLFSIEGKKGSSGLAPGGSKTVRDPQGPGTTARNR